MSLSRIEERLAVLTILICALSACVVDMGPGPTPSGGCDFPFKFSADIQLAGYNTSPASPGTWPAGTQVATTGPVTADIAANTWFYDGTPVFNAQTVQLNSVPTGSVFNVDASGKVQITLNECGDLFGISNAAYKADPNLFIMKDDTLTEYGEVTVHIPILIIGLPQYALPFTYSGTIWNWGGGGSEGYTFEIGGPEIVPVSLPAGGTCSDSTLVTSCPVYNCSGPANDYDPKVGYSAPPSSDVGLPNCSSVSITAVPVPGYPSQNTYLRPACIESTGLQCGDCLSWQQQQSTFRCQRNAGGF